ncbi:Protein Aster-C [Varanus komodoensis]|nr:Protein Aster-C [Varanus komodoensis]
MLRRAAGSLRLSPLHGKRCDLFPFAFFSVGLSGEVTAQKTDRMASALFGENFQSSPTRKWIVLVLLVSCGITEYHCIQSSQQALHEVDHGLISQLLVDSEENLRVPTEKMQAPSLYNWSSDWGFWISSSTYKYRNEEFKRQFSHIPDLESLVVDYACALQKDILLQGRLYLSENWLCFYSNIFRWETTISIALKDITFMTKEKTARLIPNAIQIATEGEKFFFTSFSARDRSYLIIFRLWQNALLEKRLTKQEFWQLVHQSYGSELGLNTEEMENMYLSSEENGQLRSSLCEEFEEKDPPKTTGVIQEPIAQIPEAETESLNGNIVKEVSLLKVQSYGLKLSACFSQHIWLQGCASRNIFIPVRVFPVHMEPRVYAIFNIGLLSWK